MSYAILAFWALKKKSSMRRWTYVGKSKPLASIWWFMYISGIDGGTNSRHARTQESGEAGRLAGALDDSRTEGLRHY